MIVYRTCDECDCGVTLLFTNGSPDRMTCDNCGRWVSPYLIEKHQELYQRLKETDQERDVNQIDIRTVMDAGMCEDIRREVEKERNAPTVRDHFAMAALPVAYRYHSPEAEKAVAIAFEIADLMMKESGR